MGVPEADRRVEARTNGESPLGGRARQAVLEEPVVRESTAFRKQALADIEAAVLLGGATCAPSMRAQVLAKAQQGVEKVMKAAIVMLTHTGTLLPGVRGAPTTN